MQSEANKTQVISLEDTRTDMLGWLTRHWVVEDAGDMIHVWCRKHRATEKWDVFNAVSQRDIRAVKPRHRRIVAAIRAHVTWRVRFRDHEQSRDHAGRQAHDRYYSVLDANDVEWFIGQHFLDGELQPWTIISEHTPAEVDPISEKGRHLTALVLEFNKFEEASRS